MKRPGSNLSNNDSLLTWLQNQFSCARAETAEVLQPDCAKPVIAAWEKLWSPYKKSETILAREKAWRTTTVMNIRSGLFMRTELRN